MHSGTRFVWHQKLRQNRTCSIASKFLVWDSGTSNLDGESGSCVMGLREVAEVKSPVILRQPTCCLYSPLVRRYVYDVRPRLHLASSYWVHSLCLGYFAKFVCVRLFSCIISACMLYYCNTVRWAWLDWGLSEWLTTLLQCFDTVGWVIRPVKTVGRITYIVLVQTLNHVQSINKPRLQNNTAYQWK